MLCLGLFSGCNDPKGFKKVYELKQRYHEELKTAVLNDHQVLVIGAAGKDEVFDTHTKQSFLTPLIVLFQQTVAYHPNGNPVVAVNGVAYLITHGQCGFEQPEECFETSGAYYNPTTNLTGIIYGIPRARSEHTI